jgi:hypothetical protein
MWWATINNVDARGVSWTGYLTCSTGGTIDFVIDYRRMTPATDIQRLIA